MVLIGDIVGDDEDAVGEGRLARRAHRQRARRRGLRRGVAPKRARSFWLDRARTAAISQAHQRVQDQRGRGDPARRASATTPTASSASTSSSRSRTSSSSPTRSRQFLGELPLLDARVAAATSDRRRPAAGASSTRKRSSEARDARSRAIATASAGRTRLATALDDTVPGAAGATRSRVSWKTRAARAAARDLRRARASRR